MKKKVKVYVKKRVKHSSENTRESLLNEKQLTKIAFIVLYIVSVMALFLGFLWLMGVFEVI